MKTKLYKKYQPFRDSNLNENVNNGQCSFDMRNHSTKLDTSLCAEIKIKMIPLIAGIYVHYTRSF